MECMRLVLQQHAHITWWKGTTRVYTHFYRTSKTSRVQTPSQLFTISPKLSLVVWEWTQCKITHILTCRAFHSFELTQFEVTQLAVLQITNMFNSYFCSKYFTNNGYSAQCVVVYQMKSIFPYVCKY